MTLQAQTVPEANEADTNGSTGYSISEWHDTAQVMDRLANLVNQPIRPIRRENMDKVLKYFDEKCRMSKKIAEQAAEVIPGGMVGGTLTANPLSCAAGYFAILEMERTNAAVVAGRAGDRLCAGLAEIIDRLGLPYVAYNQGSIVHLETSGVMLLNANTPLQMIKALKQAKPRKHMMEEFGAAYSAHGIITLAGSRLYTSLADTDEVIDDALNRFEDVMKLA